MLEIIIIIKMFYPFIQRLLERHGFFRLLGHVEHKYENKKSLF